MILEELFINADNTTKEAKHIIWIGFAMWLLAVMQGTALRGVYLPVGGAHPQQD